jgi:hypothetical protein
MYGQKKQLIAQQANRIERRPKRMSQGPALPSSRPQDRLQRYEQQSRVAPLRQALKKARQQIG